LRAVLASGNEHKLHELRAALPGWELELLPRPDYPAETGATYEENARGKAWFGRRHAPPSSWVLGEDSGIEAAALDGRPGVGSARWAADGVARIQRELSGTGDRSARYVCVIVAVDPDGNELVVSGVLDGSVIAGAPRGDEGFGYDPVFVPEGETRTVAELGNDWKRRNSHRARAAAALAAATVRASKRSSAGAGLCPSGGQPPLAR
jgi:XTP/dITP diphosphohydrolase